MPRDPNVPRGEFDTDTPTGVRQLEFLQSRVQRLELRDANMFGVDEDEGMWQRHRREYEEVRKRVDVLDAFRMKAVLLMSIASVLMGSLAGVAAVVVEHMLK